MLIDMEPVTLQPVRIAVEEGEGVLVFRGDALVAILVKLSNLHEDMGGRWFLETTFLRTGAPPNPVFDDLDQARDWIASQLQA